MFCSLLTDDLQVGDEDHQNAENPRRHFPFLGDVEETEAVFAEVRPVLILGLCDHRPTLGTLHMHIAPSLCNELAQGRSVFTTWCQNEMS